MNLDYWIARAMALYGGSFVVALGECFRRADDGNKAILRNAFAQLFHEYEQAAKRLKQEDDAKP